MSFSERFNLAVLEAHNEGISKKELIKTLNLSSKTFYNYINGNTSPKVDDLIIYERAFDKPDGWFLGKGTPEARGFHKEHEKLKKDYSELLKKSKEDDELIRYMKYIIDLAKIEEIIKERNEVKK
jgi:transcriptional regulator with XRE-family HTH domain